jgi:hypothetical protein
MLGSPGLGLSRTILVGDPPDVIDGIGVEMGGKGEQAA